MKPEITPEMFSDESLDLVIEYISLILDRLPSGMMVMVENLFYRDVWKGTDSQTHRVIGMQISYLVSQGRLRLEKLPDESDDKKRYRVK